MVIETALCITVLLGATAETSSPELPTLAEYRQELDRRWRSYRAHPEELVQSLNQLRNADAMVELVETLESDQRPSRILYLASGPHLAPLQLCDALPPNGPCHLTLTEIDPQVEAPISRLLTELEKAGIVTRLQLTRAGGGNDPLWSFHMGSRPVRLRLALTRRDTHNLIEPEMLQGIDLVISHDWSGDPLINLRIVAELMHAIRETDGDVVPLLMIEDLEQHPYPIDLFLFSLIARTRLPYGHRASERGPAVHGEVELGQPLFGGGALLSFSHEWWREVDKETLDAVFNLLVFSRFGFERQNVLSGSADPLLAPALLDWSSGFGYRTVGEDSRATPEVFTDIVPATATAALQMAPESAHRLACHIQVFRSFLNALAAGADIRSAMPSARFTRRPVPGEYPDAIMERMRREAIRQVSQYRDAKSTEQDEISQSLEVFDQPEVRTLLALCPIDEPDPDDDPAVWLDRYSTLAERLFDSPPPPTAPTAD